MSTNIRHPQALAPVDDRGKAIEPNPHFDTWDPTPHAYFNVGIAQVTLADIVLGGTHQVDGIGRSEQRGFEARRLDLAYVAGPSMQDTARLVIPIDQLLEVKRYLPTPGHRLAYVKIRPEASGYRDAEGVHHAIDNPASLIPDYGSDSARCGCLGDGMGRGEDAGDVNSDGYETGSTMCDSCAASWALDHVVVRG